MLHTSCACQQGTQMQGQLIQRATVEIVFRLNTSNQSDADGIFLTGFEEETARRKKDLGVVDAKDLQRGCGFPPER